jgi:hypothetical protein
MDETFLRGSERFSELLALGDVAPCSDHLDQPLSTLGHGLASRWPRMAWIARSVPRCRQLVLYRALAPWGGFYRSRCWLGYHYRIGNSCLMTGHPASDRSSCGVPVDRKISGMSLGPLDNHQNNHRKDIYVWRTKAMLGYPPLWRLRRLAGQRGQREEKSP